jgi:CheY-like chemotaxis protein
VASPGEGLGSTFSVFLPVYFSSTELSETLPSAPLDFQGMEEGCLKEGDIENPSPEKSKRRKEQDSPPPQQLPLSLREMRRGSVIAPFENKELQSPQCNDSQPTAMASVSVTHSKTQHDIGGSAWRVLVVDDAASNRKIMSRYLKIRGMRVDEADCGNKAIKMFTNSSTIFTQFSVDESSPSSSYDVVFLDHDMPDMTGPETAERLRSIGYRGHLIGLTGHTDCDHHQRFIAAGVSQVLAKPISVQVLDQLFECQTLPHYRSCDIVLTSILLLLSL